jgi:Trk K+ transport system NAD-binding subunit
MMMPPIWYCATWRVPSLPDQCVIAAIIRHGHITLPRGTIALEEGDEVLAVTDDEGAQKLAILLEPPDRSIL